MNFITTVMVVFCMSSRIQLSNDVIILIYKIVNLTMFIRSLLSLSGRFFLPQLTFFVVKAGGMRIVQKHPHVPDTKEDKEETEWESGTR